MPVDDVAYWEIHGGLESKQQRRSTTGDVVVLSNIDQGQETSPPAQGVTLRYVARGRESYRIGGRGYRLESGQVMIAPHYDGAHAEVRRTDRSGTLGLCTLIRGTPDELEWVQGPLVFGGQNTTMGTLMSKSAGALWSAQRSKVELARELIRGIRTGMPELRQQVLSQAAAVDNARPATRFEMVRRANLAQAYLEATIDRPVGLEEVATVVGVSPFRLLAAFQQCFGETPASYHRKLRLRLVLEEARRREVPISAVADEFGFAGASSFSHAHRRAFGYAPVWSKSEAA